MNLTKTQRQLHNFLTLAQEAGSLSKLAKLCGYRTPSHSTNSNNALKSRQKTQMHAASVPA
ncbi:TPA: hypothetical protein WH999_002033 [Neisseria meningitidis]|nr:hypothetical protein COH51_03505 [Neisseria meningitidis]